MKSIFILQTTNLSQIKYLFSTQIYIWIVITIIGCDDTSYQIQSDCNVKKVIIIVMDGARYSETWGDPSHSNIPYIADSMFKEGLVYNHFYNNGKTYTAAGHSALTTGNYQSIDNTGKQVPDSVSIFQKWIYTYNKNKTKAWIISSKSKLAVLGNTADPKWSNKYLPETNCGFRGLGVGSDNRQDELTLDMTLQIMQTYEPDFLLINFMSPDISGHSGDWNAYQKAIQKTDSLIFVLWKYINTNNCYKNNTTLFITNDHGRHLDGVADGFISHGDNCDGCRHLFLFVSGKGIKKGIVIDSIRNQLDIPVTISHILNFDFSHTQGQILPEIFEE